MVHLLSSCDITSVNMVCDVKSETWYVLGVSTKSKLRLLL